jgi:hypothetical protein
MKTIAVSFGPPAPQGVTSIMGLGADEVDALTGKLEKTLERAGWISIGVWALGVITNKRTLRAMGVGGAAAAFGVRYINR